MLIKLKTMLKAGRLDRFGVSYSKLALKDMVDEANVRIRKGLSIPVMHSIDSPTILGSVQKFSLDEDSDVSAHIYISDKATIDSLTTDSDNKVVLLTVAVYASIIPEPHEAQISAVYLHSIEGDSPTGIAVSSLINKSSTET